MTIIPRAHVRTRPLQPVANCSPERQWNRAKNQARAGRIAKVERISEAAPNKKRVRSEVRRYLSSDDARLSAALRALGGEPVESAARELCANVNAWGRQYEPIPWYRKPKRNGGYRPLNILPPRLKAVHYMSADGLKAQFTPSAGMFGVAGTSRDGAARALNAAQNEGLTYLAKIDIIDCFQSISPESLYQLPLPKEVIRRALDTRNLMFRELCPRTDVGDSPRLYGPTVTPQSEGGPRGLMQGSPASNIILAWLLRGLPAPDDARVLIYTDNIAVAARDPDRCRAIVVSLVGSLHDCPAGPLHLCDPVFASPGTDPLEFLSYEFDPERSGIGIATRALCRLESRLVALEEHETLSDLDYALETWRTLRGFRGGFSAVEDMGSALEFYVETAAINIELRGNDLLSHLHRHIFDPTTTIEGATIQRLLEGFRLPDRHRR